jgi:hypothetical protein
LSKFKDETRENLEQAISARNHAKRMREEALVAAENFSQEVARLEVSIANYRWIIAKLEEVE